MGRVKDDIEARLEAALAPTALTVRDESHRHVGHAGHRPEGETHFAVEIVSGQFVGVGRVARQRRVFAALDELMRTRIHALSLSTLTPDEAAARASGGA